MLNIHQLEALISTRMAQEQVPGLALAIVQNTQIIYARGFGVTSVAEGGVPVSPHTLFRIGSITKPLTAFLLLRLVQQGKLDLDTPVINYVPWLQFSEPAYAPQITLRLLLSHTAGLPSSYYPFGERSRDALEKHIRQRLPHYQFVAPPRTAYAYSNAGIRLAGYVAEAVMGEFYTDLMQKYVFDPLHMQHTTFDTTVAMTYPVAQSHNLSPDGVLSVQHRYSDNSGTYPSGGAISTVLDIANFAMMLMQGGRFGDEQLLDRAWMDTMQTPHAERYSVFQGQYGLGLEIDPARGAWQVGHDGLIATFTSRMTILPAQQTAVVISTNRGFSFWNAIDESMNFILSALVPAYHAPQVVPSPTLVKEQWVGCYRGAERGVALISEEEGQLTLTWNGEKLLMFPLRPDLCYAERPNGERVGIGFLNAEYISVDRYPCRRVASIPVYTPASLQPYVGDYTGADNLRFWIAAGRLWVYSEENALEIPCLPLEEHLFACDLGIFEFNLTAGQLILAHHYFLERVVNVKN